MTGIREDDEVGYRDWKNKMHDPRFIKSVTRTMNGLYMDLLQNSFIVLSRMGVLP